MNDGPILALIAIVITISILVIVGFRWLWRHNRRHVLRSFALSNDFVMLENKRDDIVESFLAITGFGDLDVAAVIRRNDETIFDCNGMVNGGTMVYDVRQTVCALKLRQEREITFHLTRLRTASAFINREILHRCAATSQSPDYILYTKDLNDCYKGFVSELASVCRDLKFNMGISNNVVFVYKLYKPAKEDSLNEYLAVLHKLADIIDNESYSNRFRHRHVQSS